MDTITIALLVSLAIVCVSAIIGTCAIFILSSNSIRTKTMQYVIFIVTLFVMLLIGSVGATTLRHLGM